MLEPRLRRYQLGDEGAGVAELLERDDLAVAEGEHMSPPELEAAAGRFHARRVVADDDHLIAARDELPRLEPRDVEQVGEELEELRDLREAAPCAGVDGGVGREPLLAGENRQQTGLHAAHGLLGLPRLALIAADGDEHDGPSLPGAAARSRECWRAEVTPRAAAQQWKTIVEDCD